MSNVHRRRRLFRLVLLLVWVGVLCGLAEIATRALGLVPPHTPQPELAIKLYYEDPNGMVSLRPGAEYFTNGDIPVVISEDGLRDQRYSRSKNPDVARVAVVGDSFTMGDGVVVEDSYPDQLERLLAEDGEAVEIINFGVTSTNTLQHLEIVRQVVLGYEPDAVVLGFNLNDFRIERLTSFELASEAFGATYRVNADQTVQVFEPSRTRLEWWKNALVTRSALVRLVVSARDAVRYAPPEGAAAALQSRVEQTEQRVSENWARTTQAVVEMASLVRAQGAEFLVLLIPAMTDIPGAHAQAFADYPYDAAHARLHAFLDAEGIAMVDVLPDFGEQPMRDVIVSRFDPHFNREGNEIVALAVRRLLVETGSLDPTNRR